MAGTEPTIARISTALPGPRSAALLARRAKVVAPGVSLAHPLFLASASGSTVTDVDGNVFIDFCGGIGCLNVGHAHAEVVAAAHAAAQQLTHACFQVTAYEGYVQVCEQLCRLAPGAFDKRALLLSTGVESVENAIKIARKSTGRAAVLAFDHAFHGRTLLGMSLTGKAAPYKNGFGPMAGDIYRLPFPGSETDAQDRRVDDVTALERALLPHVKPSELAAVIIEPVQGEGGFHAAPPAFLHALRAFCDRHGVVLIFDEVQCGMGRTGTMFASEQYGVVPDLFCLAKSIAGGLPLSAVVGRSSVVDAAHVGGLGGTFAGNPVSCAAALASLAILEREIVKGAPARLGDKLLAQLTSWQVRHPLVREVRGLGAMRAIALVHANGAPASDETALVIARARDLGVLLLSAGTYGNVIRFLMPLTIDDATLAEGLALVERALPA
ncbi:MAG TPA: 4-aminobutyrate--2-oxoglutarate transaminase [Myxococcota bacterium]